MKVEEDEQDEKKEEKTRANHLYFRKAMNFSYLSLFQCF